MQIIYDELVMLTDLKESKGKWIARVSFDSQSLCLIFNDDSFILFNAEYCFNDAYLVIAKDKPLPKELYLHDIIDHEKYKQIMKI